MKAIIVLSRVFVFTVSLVKTNVLETILIYLDKTKVKSKCTVNVGSTKLCAFADENVG